MKRPPTPAHLFHVMGIFATRGPAIGWVATWMLLLPGESLPALSAWEFIRTVPIAMLFSLMTAYVVAVFPMAVLGALCFWPARWFRNVWGWVVVSALIGAVLMVALLEMIGLLDGAPGWQMAASALPGLAAGGGSAWLSRWGRPRRHRMFHVKRRGQAGA